MIILKKNKGIIIKKRIYTIKPLIIYFRNGVVVFFDTYSISNK